MELAQQYAKLRREKDTLEKKLKKIGLEIEDVQEKLIAWMEVEQMQNFKLATGEMIIMHESVYPTVKNIPKFRMWLKKMKMESILTVHFQTLKSICTQFLSEGKPLPDGVEAFMKTRLSLRGLNNGKENGDEQESRKEVTAVGSSK